MPIHTRKNQYRGVNAHLMNILQIRGTEAEPSSWRGFHNQYIANLMQALNVDLMPLGYVAVNEESLQIVSEEDGGLPIRKKNVIPDISVYQRSAATQPALQTSTPAGDATLEFTVEETLAPENQVDAVLIYRQTEHGRWGRLVTRIELLSSSNKPGGAHEAQYNDKRSKVLRAETPLVEIDLLHWTASPLSRMPLYPQAPDSAPFYIAVSDPRIRPRGRVRIYGFGVDLPLPMIPIPLEAENSLNFSFEAHYQETYERGPWSVLVDYAVPPVNFDRYSAADQARILARMKAVQRAVERGESLDNPPLPLED